MERCGSSRLSPRPLSKSFYSGRRDVSVIEKPHCLALMALSPPNRCMHLLCFFTFMPHIYFNSVSRLVITMACSACYRKKRAQRIGRELVGVYLIQLIYMMYPTTIVSSGIITTFFVPSCFVFLDFISLYLPCSPSVSGCYLAYPLPPTPLS